MIEQQYSPIGSNTPIVVEFNQVNINKKIEHFQYTI